MLLALVCIAGLALGWPVMWSVVFHLVALTVPYFAFYGLIAWLLRACAR